MAENSTSLKPTRGDLWIVIALAGFSMIFAVLYVSTGAAPFKVPLWVLCMSSAGVAVPLLWRRRYPNQVAWIQTAVYLGAQVLVAIEPSVTQISLFLGIYSIGAWQSNRRAAFVSRFLLCAVIFIYVVVSLTVQYSAAGDMTVLQIASGFGVNLLTQVAYFGGAWFFGNRAWHQKLLLAELRDANEEVRSQEKQLTRQALDLERVRIARELHDGVAHHIAGVGIHAAAARRSLEKNPDKARESLKTIETSTRETIDELRSLVYTLRDTDDASTAEHRTKGNPGLGDLPELFDLARRSGQHVEVATVGEPRALTPITEMSIYRVIQESLTNCRRYAGSGAEVDVRLRYGTTELEVEVSDSHSADSSTNAQGTGLGIVGMRERMSALGGSLEAGPKSRGGWLVRATLPYHRTDRPAPESTAGTTSAADPFTAGATSAADSFTAGTTPVTDSNAKA